MPIRNRKTRPCLDKMLSFCTISFETKIVSDRSRFLCFLSMTLRIFYRWTEMIENAQAFPKALRNFANSWGMLQNRLEFFSNEIYVRTYKWKFVLPLKFFRKSEIVIVQLRWELSLFSKKSFLYLCRLVEKSLKKTLGYPGSSWLCHQRRIHRGSLGMRDPLFVQFHAVSSKILHPLRKSWIRH